MFVCRRKSNPVRQGAVFRQKNKEVFLVFAKK